MLPALALMHRCTIEQCPAPSAVHRGHQGRIVTDARPLPRGTGRQALRRFGLRFPVLARLRSRLVLVGARAGARSVMLQRAASGSSPLGPSAMARSSSARILSIQSGTRLSFHRQPSLRHGEGSSLRAGRGRRRSSSADAGLNGRTPNQDRSRTRTRIAPGVGEPVGRRRSRRSHAESRSVTNATKDRPRVAIGRRRGDHCSNRYAAVYDSERGQHRASLNRSVLGCSVPPTERSPLRSDQ